MRPSSTAFAPTIPLRRLLAVRLFAAVAVAGLATACATNPVTGKQQLALISEAAGDPAGPCSRQGRHGSARSVPGRGDAALCQRSGQRLAANSERPELPWTFRVVDDASVNAFALPGASSI
jgi:predicted Zn-dependent protease